MTFRHHQLPKDNDDNEINIGGGGPHACVGASAINDADGMNNDEAECNDDYNDQVPGGPVGGPHRPRGHRGVVNLKDPKNPCNHWLLSLQICMSSAQYFQQRMMRC